MKVLVAGCGAAGFSFARKLKELSSDAQITLVDKEGAGLYTKIRLPEYLAGRLPLAKLTLGSPETIAKLGIKLISGAGVASLDLANSAAKLENGDVESFETLVLASGADAANPCLKACGSTPVFTLRTLADANAIISACSSARKAIVIGGGLLGLEAAWALQARGLAVQIIECLPRLLPRQLDEIESSLLLKRFSALGFEILLGRQLQCASVEGGRKILRLDDGTALDADIVLVSAGIRPRVSLAVSAGLTVNRGIKVGTRLETSAKGVYAIGDCAELDGRIWGLWAAAKDQGEALASILAGKQETFSSPVYDPVLKVSGIQMKELRAEAQALRAEGKASANG